MDLKFNKPLMVYDLECNVLTTGVKGEPGYTETIDEIIEIGAEKLDKNLNHLGMFSVLIKGKEPITARTTEITGITQAEVDAEGVSWETAMQMFEDWAAEGFKGPNQVQLAGWGASYFDTPKLKKEYLANGRVYPFTATVLEIKSIALAYCAIRGVKSDTLSVEAMVNLLGRTWIENYGKPHRALSDAVNIASCLKGTLHQLASGVWLRVKAGTPKLRVNVLPQE